MIKGLWKSLLLVSASFFILKIDAAAQKPWTFLVYMAAANDLNSSVLLNVQEMMRVGSNAQINILVYLTLQEEGQPKVTKKLYIEQGSMTQIGHSMVRDSGDVATLQEALQWACNDYPSDHIAVVLWGYGSGVLNRNKMEMIPRAVCYDFDSENYLTDRDCLQVFSWMRDVLRGGNKCDIIAFDASFLASFEMAYTLSSCADYMIGSEESLSGNSYQYANVLHECSIKNLDPLSFAQLMVNGHKQEYRETSNHTLSAIDLNALKPLVDNCNAVAHILSTQLRGDDKFLVRSTIKKCLNHCLSFDHSMYIDLYQFYKNLLHNISGLKLSTSLVDLFKQLLYNGIQLFSPIIKANVTTAYYSSVGGLSIYFSRYFLDPSYYGLYWTEQNPNWLNFLEAFIE